MLLYTGEVFAAVIDLRPLRWGASPGLPRWALNAITNVLIKERERALITGWREDGVVTEAETSDAATSQGMLAAPGSWKKQRTFFPAYIQHKLILDFCLLQRWGDTFLLFKVTKSMVICYSCPRKLIQYFSHFTQSSCESTWEKMLERLLLFGLPFNEIFRLTKTCS